MARVVAVGLPHHITQRGNGRRDVFLTDALKQTYLNLLREQARLHRLQILAYCLMTNHLHLVAIPLTPRAMAGALRHTHGRFAQYWNTERGAVGHMWQNRYYSCAMQPSRVWPVIRYVELNPLRAGIASRAEDYRWSSAAAHSRGLDPSGVLDMDWWAAAWTQGDWSAAFSGNEESDEKRGGADAIRRATYTGRPFADSEFTAGLERHLGRKLAAQPGGRPKKFNQDKRQMKFVSTASA
jgi:REP-associated tyrosine transposase